MLCINVVQSFYALRRCTWRKIRSMTTTTTTTMMMMMNAPLNLTSFPRAIPGSTSTPTDTRGSRRTGQSFVNNQQNSSGLLQFRPRPKRWQKFYTIHGNTFWYCMMTASAGVMIGEGAILSRYGRCRSTTTTTTLRLLMVVFIAQYALFR